jgi:hypothetical protein
MSNDFIKLFDFESFIEELRNNENEDKREIIVRYESIFGPMPNNIWECSFYTDYLNFFEPVKYAVPEEIEDEFNYDLLLRLAVASFSSEYELINMGKQTELSITVMSEKDKTTKVISELWAFQILRLFEIYIEEQINLTTLIYSVIINKTQKMDSLDSIFLNASDMTIKTDKIPFCRDKFPSFDEYIKRCSYLPFSEEGELMMLERYKRMKNYRMNIVQIEDIGKIFCSNL